VTVLSDAIRTAPTVRVINNESTSERCMSREREAVEHADTGQSANSLPGAWRQAELGRTRSAHSHRSGRCQEHDVLGCEQLDGLGSVLQNRLDLGVGDVGQHCVILDAGDGRRSNSLTTRCRDQLLDSILRDCAARLVASVPEFDLDASAAGSADELDVLLPFLHQARFTDAILGVPPADRPEQTEHLLQGIETSVKLGRGVLLP